MISESQVAHPESLNEANVYSFITDGCTSVAAWSDVERLTAHLLLAHRTTSALTGRTKYRQTAQQRLGRYLFILFDYFTLEYFIYGQKYRQINSAAETG